MAVFSGRCGALVLTLLAVASARAGTPPPEDKRPVVLEGSHTLFPLGRSLALAYQAAAPGMELLVGGSGTALGFSELCAGRADLASASRPIKREEIDACAKNQVAFVELPVAYDGVAIIVNPDNTWAKDITVAELQKLFGAAAEHTITSWHQVRESWPDRPLVLFGPESDSGTSDYFREAILGEHGKLRADLQATMNGTALVDGVSSSPNAIGLLGLSYYKRNAVVLRALAVDDGKADDGAGPIAPTTEAIAAGTYQPLARPLLVYVAAKSFERAPVKTLLELLVAKVSGLTAQVGLVPLSDKAYALVKARVQKRTTGTIFESPGAWAGTPIEVLLGGKRVVKTH